MIQVYLGIGSSINPKAHVVAALEALTARYGELRLSSVFESDAVGFEGALFLNMVVGFRVSCTIGELSATIKVIEDENGRVRDGTKFNPRTLDIDILTYGRIVGDVEGVQLPRHEIIENAFVLWPLSQVAGLEVHPVLHQTYQQLWDEMPRQQVIKPVLFEWRGQPLTANLVDGIVE